MDAARALAQQQQRHEEALRTLKESKRAADIQVVRACVHDIRQGLRLTRDRFETRGSRELVIIR